MPLKTQLPNLISLTRIPLGFLFIFLLLEINTFNIALAFVTIILAALTDFLDGNLARKQNSVSNLGKLLDPICDAIFFLLVFFAFQLQNFIPLTILILFIIRELSMHLIIRPLSAKNNLSIAAKIPGKIKTAYQFAAALSSCALIYFSLQNTIDLNLNFTITIIFSISILLSYLSLYWYIKPLAQKLFKS